MTPSASRRGSRGRRLGLVAASTLVVVGLVVLAVAGYRVVTGPKPPPALAAGGQKGQGDTTWSGSSALPASRSIPTSIVIPRIDVYASLTRLSMGSDGVLNGPKTGGVAGWYHSSATPGERGAAVIAGHVDWTNGPAVFYDLGKLRPSNTIRVRRTDGHTAVFTVHATREYAKNEFPGKLVYGQTPGPQLRLVTCGGAFANGHYVDNIVVFAHLTKVD